MTTDITKEWIQQQIAEMESARDEIPFGLGVDGDNTIAAFKLTLAVLEQDPVALVYQPANIGICAPLGPSVMMLKPLSAGTKLYAAPQLPQPALVDDDKFRADFERWMVEDEKCIVGSSDPYPAGIESSNWRAWKACRAAMLQGSDGNFPVIPDEKGSSLQLRNHIRQRHAEWSQSTFGDVGPVGPLKHLSKEALEAAAEPEELSEWADMQFLLWDAQRRAGISDGEITAAMEEKLNVNMARQWPEPKDGEPRLHIKAAPQQEVKP